MSLICGSLELDTSEKFTVWTEIKGCVVEINNKKTSITLKPGRSTIKEKNLTASAHFRMALSCQHETNMTIANIICQSSQSYYLQNNSNEILKAPVKLNLEYNS